MLVLYSNSLSESFFHSNTISDGSCIGYRFGVFIRCIVGIHSVYIGIPSLDTRLWTLWPPLIFVLMDSEGFESFTDTRLSILSLPLFSALEILVENNYPNVQQTHSQPKHYSPDTKKDNISGGARILYQLPIGNYVSRYIDRVRNMIDK